MASESPSDIQGLREQILAKAAFYFSKARNSHHYENALIGRQTYAPYDLPHGFDVIVQKVKGSYSAIVICGNPSRRDMAAAGGWTHDAKSALESLLDVMSKAVARNVNLLGGHQGDMRATGDGIVNEAKRY